MAVKAANSGMIILGGGLIKHHICNANLMVSVLLKLDFFLCTAWINLITISFQRNGADYAVFINTASDFDGSDSGAKPDEAISWGKIKKDATPVKVIL